MAIFQNKDKPLVPTLPRGNAFCTAPTVPVRDAGASGYVFPRGSVGTRLTRVVNGFSLLELLVVLAIMGLLASVMFPRLIQTMDSSSFHQEKQRFIASLESLPYLCMTNRLAVKLDKFPSGIKLIDEHMQLPEGWNIQVTEPIVINANGFCLSGKLTASGRERVIALELTPPYCTTD